MGTFLGTIKIKTTDGDIIFRDFYRSRAERQEIIDFFTNTKLHEFIITIIPYSVSTSNKKDRIPI